MLSLACDYRIMTDGSKRNAFMCMNEVCCNSIYHLHPPYITLSRFTSEPHGRSHSPLCYAPKSLTRLCTVKSRSRDTDSRLRRRWLPDW